MSNLRTPRTRSTTKQNLRAQTQETSPNNFGVSVAKILAAFAAVAGVILHLMGYVSQQSYLNAWGIDSGLFPQKTDEIIILGYYAFVDQTANIISTFGAQYFWAFWGICTLVAVCVFAVIRVEKSQRSNRMFRLVRRLPDGLKDLWKSFALTFMALAGIPVAIMLAVVVLVIPVVVSENFGRSLAERRQIAYEGGCNQAKMTHICIEIKKKGKTIARGFLIESSESHIAIFDVDKKRAFSFERKDTEIIADTPKALYKEKN